jgi:hypothetical protein
MTHRDANPKEIMYQPSTSQKVLYHENHTRLSRPV